MRALIFAPLAALTLALPAAAQAQDTIPVTITFDGVLTNDPGANIRVGHYLYGSSGSSLGSTTSSASTSSTSTGGPFNGPLPTPNSLPAYTGDRDAYPHQPGAPVTISFDTQLPSQEALLSGVYDQALRRDGISTILQDDGRYRFDLLSIKRAGTQQFGIIDNISTGESFITSRYSDATEFVTGLTVFIDPIDNHYELQQNDHIALGQFEAPGYNYDPASGRLILTDATCRPNCGNIGTEGFSLSNRNRAEPVSGAFAAIHETDGSFFGFLSFLFEGLWSVAPTNNGDPTPVPEPGMLLLFGAGAAVVFQRRRKRAGKKSA